MVNFWRKTAGFSPCVFSAVACRNAKMFVLSCQSRLAMRARNFVWNKVRIQVYTAEFFCFELADTRSVERFSIDDENHKLIKNFIGRVGVTSPCCPLQNNNVKLPHLPF